MEDAASRGAQRQQRMPVGEEVPVAAQRAVWGGWGLWGTNRWGEVGSWLYTRMLTTGSPPPGASRRALPGSAAPRTGATPVPTAQSGQRIRAVTVSCEWGAGPMDDGQTHGRASDSWAGLEQSEKDAFPH